MDYTAWPPQFEGDDRHELRGLQMADRVQTLKLMVEAQRDAYRTAWTLLGRPHDDLWTALKASRSFDTKPFERSFVLLAAYWRKVHGGSDPTLPGLFPMEERLGNWWFWLRVQYRLWALHEPLIVRDICRVAVFGDSVVGIEAEERLYSNLHYFYDPDRAPNEGIEAWDGEHL